MPSAEIVAIGSELLLGQIMDTNSMWMAQRLSNLGVDLFYKTVVGDNPGRMKDVVNRALDRSDVVLTGGGLGPTQDDLTREVIAEVTGRELELKPELLDEIDKRFRSRGFVMTANNDRQAYVPRGAMLVHNPNGTAPSFIVEDSRGVVFALPGVPFELKWLFENEVVPYLQKRFTLTEVITYRVIKMTDIGESSVDDRIGYLIAESRNPTVGVLAHPGQVDVRIAAKASSMEEASKLIAPIESEVREILRDHVFAADEETMEDVVGELLKKRNMSIATYEDVTGGMVADRLRQAGPDHFVEGIIGNGPAAIHRLLAVSKRTEATKVLLQDPESLARELAQAVREHAESSLGLAVLAIPESTDTAENLAKGQAFVAVTDGEKSKDRSYNFAGSGLPDRTRLSLNAIDLVRHILLDGMK